uniref:Uncharacterized protein n=1 Tax=Ciona intestinalis TaxID=7719 RepID=H2XW55_CIOIN
MITIKTTEQCSTYSKLLEVHCKKNQKECNSLRRRISGDK